MIRPKKRLRGGILAGYDGANCGELARMGDKKRIVDGCLVDVAFNPDAGIGQGFDWDQD